MPPLATRHALVTGATGFVGSHLADRLLDRSWTATGVHNFDPLYTRETKKANLAGALAHERFRLVEADVRNSKALRNGTFVDDTVAGVEAAMPYDASPYAVVNLGNDRTVQLANLTAALERALGVEARIDRQPSDVPQTRSSPAPDSGARRGRRSALTSRRSPTGARRRLRRRSPNVPPLLPPPLCAKSTTS